MKRESPKSASALRNSPFPQMVSVTSSYRCCWNKPFSAKEPVPSAGQGHPGSPAVRVFVYRGTVPTFFVPYLSVVSKVLPIPWEV